MKIFDHCCIILSKPPTSAIIQIHSRADWPVEDCPAMEMVNIKGLMSRFAAIEWSVGNRLDKSTLTMHNNLDDRVNCDRVGWWGILKQSVHKRNDRLFVERRKVFLRIQSPINSKKSFDQSDEWNADRQTTNSGLRCSCSYESPTANFITISNGTQKRINYQFK